MLPLTLIFYCTIIYYLQQQATSTVLLSQVIGGADYELYDMQTVCSHYLVFGYLTENGAQSSSLLYEFYDDRGIGPFDFKIDLDPVHYKIRTAPFNNKFYSSDILFFAST